MRGRLALGTAQFGLDYGITNRRGRVGEGEVRQILGCAQTSGIRTIDTAIAYGESEVVVGRAIRQLAPAPFEVVTKLPADITHDAVEAAIRQSIARLNVQRLYGCLIHDVATLERDPLVMSALERTRRHGLVDHIGFSLYYPAELVRIAHTSYDIVQLPYSVVDRRFEPHLSTLRARGILIHVRSVFLQGLLLMDPEAVDSRFSAIDPSVRALRDIAETHGIPRSGLLLGFALANDTVDRVVMGVDGLASFEANVAAIDAVVSRALPLAALNGLALSNETLLVPSQWHRL